MPSARALFSTDVSAFGHGLEKLVGQGLYDESHLRPGPLRMAAAGGSKDDDHGKVRWFIYPFMRQVNSVRRSIS